MNMYTLKLIMKKCDCCRFAINELTRRAELRHGVRLRPCALTMRMLAELYMLLLCAECLMLYVTCAKSFANSRPLFDLKCYAELKRALELAGAEHCVALLDKLYEYAWQLAAQLLSYPFLWDSFMRDMKCGMEEWSCTGIGVLPTLRPNPRWHFFPC